MRRAMLTAKPPAPRAWAFSNDSGSPSVAGSGYTYAHGFTYNGAGALKPTSLSLYVGSISTGTGTIVLSIWDTTSAARVAYANVNAALLVPNVRNVYPLGYLAGNLLSGRSYRLSAYAPATATYGYRMPLTPSPSPNSQIGVNSGYFYASGDAYPSGFFSDSYYLGLFNMEYEVA